MKKSWSAGISAFAIVVAFLASSAARLDASTITLNYTGMGQLTYVTAPGQAHSQDSFSATITDLTYGAGTINVAPDFTNYLAGTGSSGPGSAVFSFGAGTLFGSTASLLNLATGQATITYTITGGTGAFSGYAGTILESAQFTSFGSFSPNVPANVSITAGNGTLTTPEPSTAVTGLLGGITLLAGIRRKRATRLLA